MLLVGMPVSGCVSSSPHGQSTTTQPTKTHIYIDGKTVVGGDGQPIELINNPDATDPTYAELLAFLKADQTDRYSYILGPPKNAYICTDFARDVHSNAKAAGIRAAFVAIHIAGADKGHALNAFQTTDRGLVYIDCTGKGLWDDPTKRTNWNRRAYVDIGQPYSVAYLDYYDHHHSRFEFFIHVGHGADMEFRNHAIYLEERTLRSLEELGWLHVSGKEWSQKNQQMLQWLQTHDVEEIGMKWTKEWIRENEAKLYSWKFVEGTGSSGTIGSGSERLVRFRSFCIDADVVWGSWFQPPIWSGTIEEKVIVIDEMPVVWLITWRQRGWREPFKVWSSGELVSQGIVKAVHIHWGE